MVGHSRSGKTSFMAGMYRYLGESTEGYGISAKKENQKEQLTKMALDLSKGRYPDGTNIQNEYEFSLNVHGEELVPFNWIDYRGGILMSDDPSDSDIDDFMNALERADALVVFLDGTKLAESGARWNIEYDLLISCITKSLSVPHSSCFHISFVITKCDMVASGANFYGLKRFDNLLRQINDSQTVCAMLIQCQITPDYYFTPFLVLAYSVYGGTPIYIRRITEAINKAKKRAEEHRPTSLLGKIFGVGEIILSGLFGIIDMEWETEYEKTWAAEKNEEELMEKLSELQSRADELLEKIKKWNSEDLITISLVSG